MVQSLQYTITKNIQKSDNFMRQLKTNPHNFQKCRQLLAKFEQQKSDINMQQIHSFIGNVDRHTLRRQCNFKSFHKILEVFTGKLVSDAFIAKTPSLLGKTSNLYKDLNYYSQQWIDHSLNITSNWFGQRNPPILKDVMPAYQLCIELGVDNNKVRFLCREILKMIKGQIAKNKSIITQMYLDKIVHKCLRVILCDPNVQKQQVVPVLKQLQKALENKTIQIDSQQNYAHSAIVCELLEVLELPFGKQSGYGKILQKFYNSYKSNLFPEQHLESISPKFHRRGQSMFEIRFQKSLQENGYWFERNKIIGIHQFDVLVKGTLFNENKPFARLANYPSIEEAPQINQEQLKIYEGITNFWRVENKHEWENSMLINLNGPYHEIYGEKIGTIRSQEIKGVIAAKHGYKRYRNIHFKEWEKSTPDKQSITKYFLKIFQQS